MSPREGAGGKEVKVGCGLQAKGSWIRGNGSGEADVLGLRYRQAKPRLINLRHKTNSKANSRTFYVINTT